MMFQAIFDIWEVVRQHFSSLSNNIQYNQVSCSILRQSRVQNLEKFKKIAKKWYYSIFVFSIFMMIFFFSELKQEYRSKFQGFKNCLHICGSCRTLFLSNWINIKNFISKKLTPTPKYKNRSFWRQISKWRLFWSYILLIFHQS